MPPESTPAGSGVWHHWQELGHTSGKAVLSNRSVLLVEDNPDNKVLTLRAFRRAHFLNEIVVAREGAQALDYLFGRVRITGRDVRNRPAMILLDLHLPKIDGLEVLRRLRADERSSSIPVVVLTTSLETQDILDGYALGANSFVRKPVSFEEFAAQERSECFGFA